MQLGVVDSHAGLNAERGQVADLGGGKHVPLRAHHREGADHLIIRGDQRDAQCGDHTGALQIAPLALHKGIANNHGAAARHHALGEQLGPARQQLRVVAERAMAEMLAVHQRKGGGAYAGRAEHLHQAIDDLAQHIVEAERASDGAQALL